MTSLSQYDIVPKEVNYIMIDYRVSIDKERGCFVINGPFDIGTIPISIPDDDPNRKQFVDLFLHKADIERGIEFLMCISSSKDTTVNEGLFIAGLNNCMKCFKYSKEIDRLGCLIEATYSNYSKDCLMAFATPQIELASSNSVRK